MNFNFKLVCILQIVVGEFALLIFSLHEFPYFTKEPPINVFGFLNRPVIIPCALNCKGCSEKVTLSWERNGEIILTKDSLHPKDDSYLIKSYSTLDNGLYACIFMYKGIRFRSSSLTHLQTAGLPELALKLQSGYAQESVSVFTCWKEDIVYEDQLYVWWYKNGLIVKPNENIVMYNRYLLISRVNVSDNGLYTCKARFQNSTMIKTSKSILLNITQALKQKSPNIIHFTSSRRVLLNGSIVIYCFVSGSPSATVQLLKLSTNGQHERQLVKNLNFVVFKISQFSRSDARKYSCEGTTTIRTTQEMHLTLGTMPSMALKGIKHIAPVPDSDILFDCNPSGFPVPIISWYYNGVPIPIRSNKLNRISRAGMYQCIATNEYGSDSRNLYITFNNTGQAPNKLSVKVLSPAKVKLSWGPPRFRMTGPYHIIWKKIGGQSNNSSTNELQYEITHGLYAGLTYKILVCVALIRTFAVSDCSSTVITMPQVKPYEGPVKMSLTYLDYKTVIIKWNKLNSSVVTTYNVYTHELFDNEKNQTHRYKVHGSETSVTIHFHGNSIYKAWITASNNAGEGPKNESFFVYTDENWKTQFLNKLSVKVKWFKNIAILNWNVTTNTKANTKLVKFKIFIISIPYKHYWRNVQITTADKDVHQYKLTGLSRKRIYRISVAALREWKIQDNTTKQYVTSLGQRTHVILYDYLQMSTDSAASIRLSSNDNLKNLVVTEPQNVECFPADFHSFLVNWDKPFNVVSNNLHYNVTIFGESDGVERRYSTSETHIVIGNLTKDVWYVVHVQANLYNLGKVMKFHRTAYLSCRRKIKVPSAPLDLQIHSVVQQKNNHYLLLVVKWKPPAYTGDSIYSYGIRSRLHSTFNSMFQMSFSFSFPYYHFILDQQEDEWVYLNPIRIIRSLSLEILVTPYNDAGQGNPSELFTPYIYGQEAAKLIVSNQTTLQPNHESPQITLGIVFGFAVSAVFILIFVIVIILEEPCRRNKQSREQNSYLYLQRLNELQSASSISQNECGDQSCSVSYQFLHRKAFQN